MRAVRSLAAIEEGQGRGGRWTVHLAHGRHDDGKLSWGWQSLREAVPPPSGRPQSTRNRNKTWLVHSPGIYWASSVCPALPWDLWILRKRIHMPFIHPEWVLLSFEAVGINSHRGSSDSRTSISKTVQYEYYRSVLLKLNKLCIPFKEKYFPQIPSVDKLYFIIILFYMKYTAKAICTTYN